MLPLRNIEAPRIEQRKSKRPRIPPVMLDDFQCDPKINAGITLLFALEKLYMDVLEKVTPRK